MKTFRKYIAFLSFSLVLLLSADAWAQRINVNPTILSFNANPGGISTQIITITNLSDRKQSYQLTLGDWLRDSVGGHKYFAPGTLDRSCSKWISFDNSVVEIEPQKSRDVRVTLTAPSDPQIANEMKWSMIFIQNVLEQTGDENKGAQMKATIREVYRIGIHIYQTPPALNKKEARALSLEPDKAEKNIYNFSLVNTGKAMIECKARLLLTNLSTGSEIKLDETEFPVFPDGKRIVKLAIPPTVPKGKYSMLAILEYDPDMPLEAIESSVDIN
jgi:hypothetical protein